MLCDLSNFSLLHFDRASPGTSLVLLGWMMEMTQIHFSPTHPVFSHNEEPLGSLLHVRQVGELPGEGVEKT